MYRGKRLFDLGCLLVTAPVWVPALVVVAILVRIRLGGPVLFRQRRIGMSDRPFDLVKFRTMTDTRDGAGNLLPDAERLPAFGRLLRSTSLDEAPEVWNVLLGDMSVVGPRPLLPQYLERYSAEHRRRHDTRPGLTGLAQVRGRNSISWTERLDLDVEYVRTASMVLDLRILMQTVAVVFSRRGVTTRANEPMPEFKGYREDTSAE